MYKKVINCPWFYNDKWKTFCSPTKKGMQGFLLFFLLNNESKITYWNIKVRAERACHHGERRYFSQNQCFLPSHLHLMPVKHIIGHLLLKNANACAHTSVTLCTIKEWGGQKWKKREKLYNSSQDVVASDCIAVPENVFLVWRNRVKWQGHLLVDTSCLLLAHTMHHFQMCGFVSFIDGMAVRQDSDLHHRQTLLFITGLHQLAE